MSERVPHVCPKCDGMRTFDGKQCPTCDGRGVVFGPGDPEEAAVGSGDDNLDLTYRGD